jgi:DNA replication protein DnaC
VLDEVGYLPLSRAEGNMVFQLVSRRYERGSVILTINKTFAEIGPGLRRRGARLGDSVTGSCTTPR